MSVVESVRVKNKDKRSETHHGAPRDPVAVLFIIEGRDKLKRTWQSLGDDLGITRAGARDLYNRWYEWSKDPNTVEMAKTLIKTKG